eukprot:7882807-Pyramimonas_sp.AAC.1
MVEQISTLAKANDAAKAEFHSSKQVGVLEYFLSGKSKTLPFHEECGKLGVDRRGADTVLKAAAAACSLLQNRDVANMARQLVDSIVARGGRALSWAESV